MREIMMPIGLERRKEDYPLITGRAYFVDDIRLPAGRPSVLHMAVVRSPYASEKVWALVQAARQRKPQQPRLMPPIFERRKVK